MALSGLTAANSAAFLKQNPSFLRIAMLNSFDIAERLVAKAKESIDSRAAKSFEEFKEKSNFLDYFQAVFGAGYTSGFAAAAQEVIAMACNE